MAASFRAADFQGWAVINDLEHGDELVDFVAAKPLLLPGLALDLGTTHLEASLLDMAEGRVLAKADRPNGQIDFGTDILTRIHFAARPGGLEQLQAAVVATIAELAGDLCGQAGCGPEEIRGMSVSGNTTMVHLLLGLSPATICREPYIPLVNWLDPCLASELDLPFHPGARVWFFPSVGSYFGGDLIAGIVAAELADQEELSLLIDVGTNAEVVLGNKDFLIACAGAAGPALEGGIARMGMRAGPGAIEKVRIHAEEPGLTVDCQTIGAAPPRGLCGSGIIDLVAALYLSQLIDIRGKFKTKRWPERFVESKDGLAFVVVPAKESQGGESVLFSQVDLDAMMRSKAAMYAILSTLLAQVDVQFSQLQRIFVAGSFGKHIDPRQAITLGMLPDLDLATFQAIGNSSLAGAQQVLLNGDKRRLARQLPAKITYLELNVNQDFMIRFSGCRFIPHTDPALFPSVPHFPGDTGN
ncbi:MAG: ASKHA domain-containing protein [Thermodesulfobacteriota bacterium]